VLRLGYALSSEEHRPRDLIDYAVQAEQAGFSFALVSDHYHPWLDVQGQSSFVWSVLGSIAVSTQHIRLGTGVTCPILRIHPAIIAQAAATVADLMPGRFFLGLGTGENLNEHVLGQKWPPADKRLAMLEEAITVIRELWRGELTDFEGDYFTVENARIYTLPAEPPPIYVAAAAENAARLAGRHSEGLITTSPDAELVNVFQAEGNSGPRIAQLSVCWAESEEQARSTAMKYWPNAGLRGSFKQEIALPSHFAEMVTTVTEDQVAESILCSPDPGQHFDRIKKYVDAGFDHVYVHQVGPDQAGFFRFYQREVLPQLSAVA
jgi:coenzyme F420-dependent glucose-6-phosphate dehydrogenase